MSGNEKEAKLPLTDDDPFTLSNRSTSSGRVFGLFQNSAVL